MAKKKVIQPLEETVSSDEVEIPTTLFMNGGSQAVRIPARWKFEDVNVTVSYNAELDAVVIRKGTKEAAKAKLIELIKSLSDEDRKEIAKMRVKREVGVPKVKPEVEQFFKELK